MRVLEAVADALPGFQFDALVFGDGADGAPVFADQHGGSGAADNRGDTAGQHRCNDGEYGQQCQQT